MKITGYPACHIMVHNEQVVQRVCPFCGLIKYLLMKITNMLLLSLFISLLSCGNMHQYETIINDLRVQHGYKDHFLGTFRCGVFVPPDYDPGKKYPLIIFLHGYSDTTTWDMGWYHDPVLSADPCIVITPKCPVTEKKGWGGSWDSKPSPMMAKAFEMIDLVGQALNLDSSRFYICGSSMGGFGTFAAIRQHPDLFAAAYVECANGDTGMAAILTKIPLWMFHGSEDPVVPVKGARDMYEAVRHAGGNQIRYTEYKGVGHNVWDYTGKEKTLTPWLLAQKKGIVHNTPDSLMNLKATVTGSQDVLLAWDMPAGRTDPDDQVWYTRIYRDGQVISEVYNDQNTYTDSTVVSGKPCLYQVSAVNYYFWESALSPALTVVPGKQ